MTEFHTKLAGVTFTNPDGSDRQDLIEDLADEIQRSGPLPLKLRREPHNPYDSHAIAVLNSAGKQLGFVAKDVASQLAPQIDSGTQVTIHAVIVTGNGTTQNYGVNIRVTCS
jgi:hypothetical protein